MGRLAELSDQVAKYRCDRCGFMFLISELVDEEATGLVVDKKCLDKEGFTEATRDRQPTQHYFK